MNDYIIFGDVDSRNYGVRIFDSSTDSSPARVYERYNIAGRNGDVFVDQKRFENVQTRYWGIIHENYDVNLRNFRGAMKSQVGYKRLEDSFHYDEYVDACFIDALEVYTARGRGMGKFEIVFDRKPQRWLISGENAITLTNSSSIENPTNFASNPLLRVYGSGTLYLGNYGITVGTSEDPYTEIDCFSQEAYYQLVSKNSIVQFLGTGKPVLNAGITNVQVPNGIRKIDIVPRWYTI